MQVAESLVAVIAQALVRTTDGKRAAIHEIMINTDAIKDYILRGEVEEIEAIIPQCRYDGMCTMNQCLYELYEAGRIDEETAIENSPNPTKWRKFYGVVSRAMVGLKPVLYKGLASLRGEDVVFCRDPSKQGHWHQSLCQALQQLLDLEEPPLFLSPCYTAAVDYWFDEEQQCLRVAAEVYPLAWPIVPY